MHTSSELLRLNKEDGSLVPNVFGVIDGDCIPCADYGYTDLENAYIEGYNGHVEVTNIFVFNFFREIIHAGVNYPGIWDERKILVASALLLDRLSNEKAPVGRAILGDSEFVARACVIRGKIILGRKSTETEDVPESELLAVVDAILYQVVSRERQSAEWSIRAVKEPFRRLRLHLTADSAVRFHLLYVCVNLYNIPARVNVFNQNVYGNLPEVRQPWEQRYLGASKAERGAR